MFTTINKNILILGIVTVLLVTSWVAYEITKSTQLIAIASDPGLSTQRGFSDAQLDFNEGYARFHSWGENSVPGLTEIELNGEFKEWAPYRGFMCGTGIYLNELKLYLEGYEYNEYYVTAYNTRLKKLINSSE